MHGPNLVTGFVSHQLDENHVFYTGRLPDDLGFDPQAFAALWATHPATFDEIMMHGEKVKLPRWQQAFGINYHFSGRERVALPVPESLHAVHMWAKLAIDDRLNGLLLNFYDGALGHYIGPHRDSIKNMVEGAPIVTISLGESRKFRISPWKGKGNRDFDAHDGSVFVLPYAANRAFTHAVPKAKYHGKRISITLRGFKT